MHILEGRQWIDIVTDKLIRVLGSLRRISKWCLSVEMPEKHSLQVQGTFPLITGGFPLPVSNTGPKGVQGSECMTGRWLVSPAFGHQFFF